MCTWLLEFIHLLTFCSCSQIHVRKKYSLFWSFNKKTKWNSTANILGCWEVSTYSWCRQVGYQRKVGKQNRLAFIKNSQEPRLAGWKSQSIIALRVRWSFLSKQLPLRNHQDQIIEELIQILTGVWLSWCRSIDNIDKGVQSSSILSFCVKNHISALVSSRTLFSHPVIVQPIY